MDRCSLGVAGQLAIAILVAILAGCQQSPLASSGLEAHVSKDRALLETAFGPIEEKTEDRGLMILAPESFEYSLLVAETGVSTHLAASESQMAWLSVLIIAIPDDSHSDIQTLRDAVAGTVTGSAKVYEKEGGGVRSIESYEGSDGVDGRQSFHAAYEGVTRGHVFRNWVSSARFNDSAFVVISVSVNTRSELSDRIGFDPSKALMASMLHSAGSRQRR